MHDGNCRRCGNQEVISNFFKMSNIFDHIVKLAVINMIYGGVMY